MENVAGFGYNLDTGSASATEDRSIDDSTTSSSDSVDPEDTWWVAAAAGAGVGLAVVLLGALAFTKVGKKRRAAAVMSPTNARSGSKGRGGGGSFADETKSEPAST